MAIEIKITKELGNYTPKLIGPFTVRNFTCIVIAVIAGCIPYYILSRFIPEESARMVFLPFGFLAWLFGFYKPYGYDMPTEQFIKSVFIKKVLAKPFRPYKCKNTMEELLTFEDISIEEDETNKKDRKKEKRKKDKSPKYQRSSLAIK